MIGKKLTHDNYEEAFNWLRSRLHPAKNPYLVTRKPNGLVIVNFAHKVQVINIGDRIWGEWVKHL